MAAGAAALGLAVALRKRAARARAPGARSARELAATYGGEGPKGPGAVREGEQPLRCGFPVSIVFRLSKESGSR